MVAPNLTADELDEQAAALEKAASMAFEERDKQHQGQLLREAQALHREAREKRAGVRRHDR